MVDDILNFAQEADVKFIRLAFCDPFGVHKNISIMPTELKDAFERGISFDASSIRGFEEISRSDLFLFPDATTLTALPWRPEPGCVIKFFCDIKYADGSIYIGDSRNILRGAIKKLSKMGYGARIGSESEFYLFKLDDYGNPTYTPIDNGTYFDVAPLDQGEDVRREICLVLSEMGLMPETSHHEQGPGQNEIDFKYSDAMTCADNLIAFKNVVKIISARHGLFASFMPKPLDGKSGSGLHINISLMKNGRNVFSKEHLEQDVRDSFLAGILAKISEITLFLNSTVNSYDRLGAFEAPDYVSWSHQNRSALIRIPAQGDTKTRIELRSPDGASNPYIAFALVLEAGIYGIENKLQLEDENTKIEMLPQNLEEAILKAKNSLFVKQVLGEEFVEKYITIKELELQNYYDYADKKEFYTNEYFCKL